MGMPQGQGQMMSGLMHSGMMGGPMMPSMMPGFPHMPVMPEQQLVNPGLNDAPLEFNTNKNKPPMPISGGDIDERGLASSSQFNKDSDKERERRRERESRSRQDRSKDRSKDTTKEVEKSEVDSDSNEMAPVWGGIIPPPMPYQVMGMPLMDPNMMIPQFGMVAPGLVDGGVVKEVIQLKSVTLIPPPPGSPLPTTRERPPGCKTIFVGGLAENTSEEIIREIFIRCGEMLTVRLSTKKFCHIRFVHESSVDAALFFSGYRMRIDNKTDASNTGRLHVDFAQARDDQYEWECKQRQLQREQRHRDRVEKERLRVPSPPPVPHYTEHEATSISEKIKVEDTFGKAVQVVITWLERGDCNKRNASVFYSMIQSTNSHIRRLLSEKASHEEELQRAKDLMKARMQGLLLQYAQVERVFTAASHKKVWDHFTKAQRKNIEMWKKQAAEIKAVELEEHLNTGAEEEMELSDEEEGGPKKKFKGDDKINALKEENDSLRCQLEAYKNEVDLVRTELKAELEQTESQLKLAQQTLHGMQQQLVDAKTKQSIEETKVAQLEAKLAQVAGNSDSNDSSTNLQSVVSSSIVEEEARLVGLISMFLHVHPFGAGLDYVWSYLQKITGPTIKPAEVESLLQRFPTLFQQELCGIGANMERRWVITAFKNKDHTLPAANS